MRIIRLMALAASVSVVACGGGGTKTSGGGGAPGLASWITSSTPGNNQKRVAPDQTITITTNQQLDPTSVNENTVQVIPDMSTMRMGMSMGSETQVVELMERLPGVVTFNAAASQITFKPNEHLHTGMDFKINLNGVKSAGGTALSNATIAFATLVNPMIQRITYSAPGVVDRIHVYDVDSTTGMHTKMSTYQGTVSPATLLSYRVMLNATLPNGTAVSEIEYDATNTIKSYSAPIREGGAIVAFAMYTGPGADLLWNQTDDVIDTYFTMVEAHGIHMQMQRFAANNRTPAPWSSDPTARAASFTSRGVELSERDTMGRTLKQIIYSSLGANGVIDFVGNNPQPSDDIVTQYRVIKRNAQGQRISGIRYGKRAGRDPLVDPAINPAGPDNILFTPDDVITEYELTERSATGHELGEVEYTDPGAKTGLGGIATLADWESVADNRVDHYSVTTYSAVNGIRDTEKEYNATDGIKGNADDVLTEEMTFNTLL